MLPIGNWNCDRMSSVKVLPFDGRPSAEFSAWKRSVCLHVEAKFGSAGSVFRTGKYFSPPLLRRPADEDLSADNDASGLKKATFLQALGRRDKNVEDLENAKQYMYAELFSMISEESKRKLSESTRWANIEKVQWTKYALSIKHQTREALSTTGYSRGEYTIG